MPETLSNEVDQLKEMVRQMKHSMQIRVIAEYDRVKFVLDDAIFSTREIQEQFESTVQNVDLATLLSDISEANLPTSEKFGFEFVKVVEDTAKDTLLQGLPGGEKTKTRFLDVLKKVINNPIASTVINSSPVGAIASNIINMASNFIDTTAVGGAMKKVVVSTKDVIAKEKLDQFHKSLERYIIFYDSLLVKTQHFQIRLDNIRSKNEQLSISLSDYYVKYLTTLGINPKAGHIIDQFNNIFNLPLEADGTISYETVLNKPEVKNAELIASTTPAFRIQVDSFISEFSKALSEFLEGYIVTLETAMEWDDNVIKKQKLSEMIQKLKLYKEKHIKVEEAICSMTGTSKTIYLIKGE